MADGGTRAFSKQLGEARQGEGTAAARPPFPEAAAGRAAPGTRLGQAGRCRGPSPPPRPAGAVHSVHTLSLHFLSKMLQGLPGRTCCSAHRERGEPPSRVKLAQSLKLRRFSASRIPDVQSAFWWPLAGASAGPRRRTPVTCGQAAPTLTWPQCSGYLGPPASVPPVLGGCGGREAWH